MAEQERPATVTVPITWNDADRDAGIDWWIANATYWYEQAQANYRQRDNAAALQERSSRTLAYLIELLDGPLDPTLRTVVQACINSLTAPVGRFDG